MLGDSPLLELIQRVRAGPLGEHAKRAIKGLERDSGFLLEGEESVHQRRCEDAAEVADDGGDQLALTSRYTPSPSSPRLWHFIAHAVTPSPVADSTTDPTRSPATRRG